MSALDDQVGGKHYRDMAIQPVTYITTNKLGYIEGCVVKYVSRWRSKGGVEDLRKAKHFLDILIELELASAENERERLLHSGSRFRVEHEASTITGDKKTAD
jgi:hypothetical protein